MNRAEKIGNLIYELSEDCEKILKEYIQPKRSSQEVTTIGYYLTVIEYTKTIGILVRKEKFISIPLICRSVLEAIIDILNLTKDEDYYYVLRKISLRNSRKRAQSWYNNKENLYHPDIENLPKGFSQAQKDIKNDLKEIDKVLEKYSEKDITDLKTRFRKAGLEDLYESIFWLTSPETHNDLSVVWERHIDERQEGVFFHTTPKEGIEAYSPHINLVNTFLIAALGDIYEKLKDKNFNEYFMRLEIKRKKIENLL